jgi:hypothetical protein
MIRTTPLDADQDQSGGYLTAPLTSASCRVRSVPVNDPTAWPVVARMWHGSASATGLIGPPMVESMEPGPASALLGRAVAGILGWLNGVSDHACQTLPIEFVNEPGDGEQDGAF